MILLKGHGNKANFPRFLHKSFGIGPLHISSCSDFGSEFADFLTRRVGESLTL
jgi:hypothetical protein